MAGKKNPFSKKAINNRKKKEEGKKKKVSGSKKNKTVRKSGGVRETRGKARIQVDVFTEAAMENAYYSCHCVQELLKFRGFPWPELQKKKKKGKKK